MLMTFEYMDALFEYMFIAFEYSKIISIVMSEVFENLVIGTMKLNVQMIKRITTYI